jgi:hypothetical protein
MSSKNRLSNPSFAYIDAGMPLASLADGTIASTARNWFIESFADGGTGAVVGVTEGSFPPGTLLLPGEPMDYLQIALTTAGASLGTHSYLKFGQRLAPNVLNGQYANFSFWLNSSIATQRVAVAARRSYGTGGSPSPDDVFVVKDNLVQTVGKWQRYSVYLPILPINDGINPRTLGTNGDAFLEVAIYLQAGSAVGVTRVPVINQLPGAWTLQIAQPQLEAGTNATSWVDGDPALVRSDGSGDPQVFDSVAGKWRTVTAPAGVLSLSNAVP